MIRFMKAQVASLVASLTDFVTTIILVEILGFWYLAASITGTIVGGMVSFMIGRIWVFDGSGKKVHIQAVKYAIVWIGNLVLNGAGVFVVTHYLHVNYVISKVLVSLLIGFSYNYLLQKKFVFK
jgi:putative flippase GtrA